MDLCELYNEPGRLHSLMASCGPAGEFALYVMQRLQEEGRASELLELPAEFNDLLTSYLKEKPLCDTIRCEITCWDIWTACGLLL
eukprot:scaffold180455_cov45-Prasinocladus_malaysianus.AAC.3